MKILLAAATAAEIAPTVEWIRAQPPQVGEQVDMLITGVGLLAATFSLTRALAGATYDFVLGAGIAGAFDGSLMPGQCVIVGSEQSGDLGAEDNGSFLDVFSLGLQQQDEAPFTSGRLVNRMKDMPWDPGDLKVVSSLTVNTVSGSAPTIAARRARYSAQIESMEGAALHYVCLSTGQPFLQLRAISNFVTPRDRAAWKIPEAIIALNEQLIAWLKVPA